MSINRLLRGMCQPTGDLNTNLNLRVRSSCSKALLLEPRFAGIDTGDLIALASEKIKGITDRCAAIAVLKGVR